MIRRFLLSAAVLFLMLWIIPGCGSDNPTQGKGGATPTKDPGMKPGAGRSG